MLEIAEKIFHDLAVKGTSSLKSKPVSELLKFKNEILFALSSLPRITNQADNLNEYQKLLIEALAELSGIIAHISQLVDDGIINESAKLKSMIELGFLKKQTRRLAELEMVLDENKSSRHIEQIDM